MFQDSVQATGMMSCLRPSRILLILQPPNVRNGNRPRIAEVITDFAKCDELELIDPEFELARSSCIEESNRGNHARQRNSLRYSRNKGRCDADKHQRSRRSQDTLRQRRRPYCPHYKAVIKLNDAHVCHRHPELLQLPSM